MKKIFEYIGILSLVCFSFFLTDKTVSVVQEIDDIMIQIKNNQHKYHQNSMNASVDKQYIVPGLPEKSVDIEKSYTEMKKVGVYDTNHFVYKVTKPKENLDNYLNKYIVSGNPQKRMVSIILIIKDKSLSSVLNLLGDKRVAFVLDNDTISTEIKNIELALERGNEFLIGDTNIQQFLSTKQQLDTLKNPTMICYNEKEDKKFLSLCKKNKYYSVTSTTITKTPLSQTKDLLRSGSFLVFEVNQQFLKEFPNILSYIESKGYVIAPLSFHIKED